MHRWKLNVLYSLFIYAGSFNLVHGEEVNDYNKLSRKDSFYPEIDIGFYRGPYGRILSLKDVKQKVLDISKGPFLTQENGKFYKFRLHEREYYVWITPKEDSVEIKEKKQENYFPIILQISKIESHRSNWTIAYFTEKKLQDEVRCRFLVGLGEREAAEKYGEKSTMPYNSIFYEWKCEKGKSKTLLTSKFEIAKDGKEVLIFNNKDELITSDKEVKNKSWLYHPDKIDPMFNFQTCLYEYLYNGKIDKKICN